MKVTQGLPYPLGATWDGRGVNFALFSGHAERVELCLFDSTGRREVQRINLPEYTNQIWHGYLPEARPGMLYGYRVYGPYEPHLGHRFNPNKLLLDPYARELKGKLRWSGAHMGYRVGSSLEDLSFDRRDSAHRMPKCVVVDPAFTWGQTQHPRTPWTDTVIYETHVRGFTMRHEGIPKGQRGTYAGMSQAKVIDYIKSLGITAVELMPVHAFVDDQFLEQKKLRNYWGYSTLGFFAPEPRYFANAELAEFKRMVAQYHDAGIEVLLDVVYNHTAEGNHLGPTLSFRGIDNASYYRLHNDNQRYYINDTGCGNTLNMSHPRVLQMVMDSLRYWVSEMKVDGFRFDLASVLGRENHGFDKGSGFFDALRQDPVLAQVKLIAEPWDIGPGGYQLGNFPSGWGEWNDRFRDTVRRFWRADEAVLPELARRLHGSSDIFEHEGRRPWSSINYVSSHDGFPLTDLVSYETRHNEANGENNQDGHQGNYSVNYGVEGPTEDVVIQARREQHKRNLLATVFLAQGTPMLLAGDERGNSQGGNNNAYCQDNEISWLSWEPLNAQSRDGKFYHFVKQLIQLRKDYPVLRRAHYVHGRHFSPSTEYPDIHWLSPQGGSISNEEWHQADARCLGMLLAGDVSGHQQEETPLKSGKGARSAVPAQSDESLLIIFNAQAEDVVFALPESPGRWECILTTASPESVQQSTLQLRTSDAHHSAAIDVPSHATLVLALRLDSLPASNTGETS